MAIREQILRIAFLGDATKLERGTRKAKSELTGLEKFGAKAGNSIKGALGALGLGFGAATVIGFLRESAKAASDDARAQALLASVAQRTAHATQQQIDGTEALIGRMELATGIADDDLRPAFNKLVSVTHNVRKSQNLLKLAVDASVKSGKPLNAVTQAFGKYLAGNKKGLEKIFPELVGTTDQLGKLKQETAGFAKANADPFQIMQRNLDNLKETIGGPLATQFAGFVNDITNPKTKDGKNALLAAQAAFQGLGDDIGKMFGAFSSNGDSAVGFLNIVKGVIDSIRLNMESITILTDTITGKKFDANKYPVMKDFTSTLGFMSTEGQKWLRSKMGGPAYTPWKPTSVSPNQGGYSPTYNINVKTSGTSAQMGADVVKSIQQLEKATGVKWLSR